MLGNAVFGSRTWICTMAAPALAASIAEAAICAGVTGTAGFFPTESADPVTAQDIITLRCMGVLSRRDVLLSPHITALRRIGIRDGSVAWNTPPCTPLCAALSLVNPSLERIRTKNQGRFGGLSAPGPGRREGRAG